MRELFFLNLIEFNDGYKHKGDSAEMYNYRFENKEEVMFELCERIRDYCEYKSIKINENLNGISLLEWYGENIFGEYVEKPFKWEAYKIIIRVENGEILEETEFLDDLNLY